MSSNAADFSYRPWRHTKEGLIEFLLFLAALSAVATTVAIVAILVYESIAFFKHVPLLDFLTDTQWTPLFSDAHYGILPLLSGTLMGAGRAQHRGAARHHHRDLPERIRPAQGA